MVKIAVVGGGIIGLSSACCLKRKYPKIEITLISEKFSPNTTGDGSAGVLMPYLLQDTPKDLVERWSKGTLDFFLSLWKTPEGGEVGISLIPVSIVTSNDEVPPYGVFGLHELTPTALQRFNIPTLRKGYSFTSFTCEPMKLLPYFLQEFTLAGGNVEERKVMNLESLGDNFDIVVNCTGLGAREVVSDESVIPIRGQVLRVEAPSVFQLIMCADADGRYIIPNQESVVLGGTHQENDWNTKSTQEDTDFITSGCFRMLPSLKDAVVLSNWVGLRPGRPTVRLEAEIIKSTKQKTFTIIHNYGHGGSGVTLCWGCALNVAELVENYMLENSKLNVKSLIQNL